MNMVTNCGCESNHKLCSGCSDDIKKCPVCNEELGLLYCAICMENKKEIVETGSPLSNSEETYKALNTDIEERLKKLEEREKLINTKYTEQFGKMEQSMTQFNSTKTLLENFIEAWKKQK